MSTAASPGAGIEGPPADAADSAMYPTDSAMYPTDDHLRPPPGVARPAPVVAAQGFLVAVAATLAGAGVRALVGKLRRTRVGAGGIAVTGRVTR